MANIKVSEMTEASVFDDGDYTMIIQGNANKKISHENMLGDIKDNIGNLSNLTTTDKTDLVSAINENNTNIVGLETYSLNETDTGKIWIDGSKIYRKVIDFGALPNTATKEIDMNINDYRQLAEPVRGFTYKNNVSDSFPLPYISTAGDIYNIDLAVTTNNKIRLRTKTDRSDVNAYIILEYIKTS